MRTRPALLCLLLLTACSSGGSDEPRSLDASPTAGPSASATTTTAPSAGTATRPTAPAAGGAATLAPAEGGAAGTSAPGEPVPSPGTAPGSYTYDSSGTITYGTPGTTRRADGTATLTVSALRGDRQRSTLHNESTGDVVQDLVMRDAGTYVAGLTLTSPAFSKEFRPATPVLLVADPARVGSRWSWSGRSTDGATTASTTSTVSRVESLVVGGTRTEVAVLQTHLVLRGDVDYTADLTTWWAPAFRLPVKTRTVGKGTYSGFAFSNDITATMRSVRPS